MGEVCERCIQACQFGVSDAMPGQLGWVIFARDQGGRFRPAAIGARKVTELSQAQCEMLAVEALVHELPQRRGDALRPCPTCRAPPLLIVAVDADGARHCVNKGI